MPAIVSRLARTDRNWMATIEGWPGAGTAVPVGKTKPHAPVISEADRLASLYAYGQLDTAPERDFDQIVALAAEICGTPMALVSLVDADRQWFKAHVGIDLAETPRSVSFCQYAIAGADDVMEVPDTQVDRRFSANPF